MAAIDRTEWPDARLDELSGRVANAATKDDIASLRRELTERSTGVNENVNSLRKEVRSLTGDPVSEGRQKRQAIVVAVVAALSGVGATSMLYFLAGAGVH